MSLKGLIAIFEHIGRRAAEIWFVNTKTIVTKVLKEGEVHLRTILSDSATLPVEAVFCNGRKPGMKRQCRKQVGYHRATVSAGAV